MPSFADLLGVNKVSDSAIRAFLVNSFNELARPGMSSTQEAQLATFERNATRYLGYSPREAFALAYACVQFLQQPSSLLVAAQKDFSAVYDNRVTRRYIPIAELLLLVLCALTSGAPQFAGMCALLVCALAQTRGELIKASARKQWFQYIQEKSAGVRNSQLPSDPALDCLFGETPDFSAYSRCLQSHHIDVLMKDRLLARLENHPAWLEQLDESIFDAQRYQFSNPDLKISRGRFHLTFTFDQEGAFSARMLPLLEAHAGSEVITFFNRYLLLRVVFKYLEDRAPFENKNPVFCRDAIAVLDSAAFQRACQAWPTFEGKVADRVSLLRTDLARIEKRWVFDRGSNALPQEMSYRQADSTCVDWRHGVVYTRASKATVVKDALQAMNVLAGHLALRPQSFRVDQRGLSRVFGFAASVFDGLSADVLEQYYVCSYAEEFLFNLARRCFADFSLLTTVRKWVRRLEGDHKEALEFIAGKRQALSRRVFESLIVAGLFRRISSSAYYLSFDGRILLRESSVAKCVRPQDIPVDMTAKFLSHFATTANLDARFFSAILAVMRTRANFLKPLERIQYFIAYAKMPLPDEDYSWLCPTCDEILSLEAREIRSSILPFLAELRKHVDIRGLILGLVERYRLAGDYTQVFGLLEANDLMPSDAGFKGVSPCFVDLQKRQLIVRVQQQYDPVRTVGELLKYEHDVVLPDNASFSLEWGRPIDVVLDALRDRLLNNEMRAFDHYVVRCFSVNFLRYFCSRYAETDDRLYSDAAVKIMRDCGIERSIDSSGVCFSEFVYFDLHIYRAREAVDLSDKDNLFIVMKAYLQKPCHERSEIDAFFRKLDLAVLSFDQCMLLFRVLDPGSNWRKVLVSRLLDLARNSVLEVAQLLSNRPVFSPEIFVNLVRNQVAYCLRHYDALRIYELSRSTNIGLAELGFNQTESPHIWFLNSAHPYLLDESVIRESWTGYFNCCLEDAHFAENVSVELFRSILDVEPSDEELLSAVRSAERFRSLPVYAIFIERYKDRLWSTLHDRKLLCPSREVPALVCFQYVFSVLRKLGKMPVLFSECIEERLLVSIHNEDEYFTAVDGSVYYRGDNDARVELDIAAQSSPVEVLSLMRKCNSPYHLRRAQLNFAINFLFYLKKHRSFFTPKRMRLLHGVREIFEGLERASFRYKGGDLRRFLFGREAEIADLDFEVSGVSVDEVHDRLSALGFNYNPFIALFNHPELKVDIVMIDACRMSEDFICNRFRVDFKGFYAILPFVQNQRVTPSDFVELRKVFITNKIAFVLVDTIYPGPIKAVKNQELSLSDVHLFDSGLDLVGRLSLCFLAARYCLIEDVKVEPGLLRTMQTFCDSIKSFDPPLYRTLTVKLAGLFQRAAVEAKNQPKPVLQALQYLNLKQLLSRAVSEADSSEVCEAFLTFLHLHQLLALLRPRERAWRQPPGAQSSLSGSPS